MLFNFKDNSSEETGTSICEATEKCERHFLEREKDITDIESLIDRVEALNKKIEECNVVSAKYESILHDIEYSKEVHLNLSGSIELKNSSSNVSFYVDISRESSESFTQITVDYLKKEIDCKEKLARTCRDEIDWLNEKFKAVADIKGNKTFNFNPEGNHV